FSEEHKTIQTHQQAKIKVSNERIKWVRNGEIVNNGIGWYSYSQSQTLYTMGVKDTKMMSVPDSNFTIYMQNNPDTRDLRMGERIFVGRRVYKINFIDDVSRAGLINYLLRDRKSTRLNSSHVSISYAVFCLKKKNNVVKLVAR